MSNPFQHCDNSITPSCPIEATVLGYYPSIPWNIVYVAIFTLCCIGQIFLGIRYKVRSYTWVVGLGCFGEVVGYAARVVLSENPFDEWALGTQYVALTAASALFVAGIYPSLKYAMLSISPQHSIIHPKLYTWIFISCDVVSIILQMDASGVTSAANTDPNISTDHLNIVLLVGICLQAFTLLVFGVMAGFYAYTISRNRHALEPAAASLVQSRQFRIFLFAMSTAYLVLLIRGLYRIAEYSGGWKNSISRNQVSFMILDGLMCVFAALVMTLIHPGIYFEAMGSRKSEQLSQNHKIRKNRGLFTSLLSSRKREMSSGGEEGQLSL